MLYRVLYLLCNFFFKILFRLKIEGSENVPRQGGFIVVSNHVSHLDPIILSISLKRPIHFMAKEELFEIPVFGFIISRLNAFPVRRGSFDRKAIQNSLKLLDEEKVLGMFPEGTRSTDGKLNKPHHGPATFAYRVGVPIVPMGLIGTGEALRKGTWLPKFKRIKVRIGEPLYFSKSSRVKIEKSDIIRASNEIMESISSLIKENE